MKPKVAAVPAHPVASTGLCFAMMAIAGISSMGTATTQIATFGVFRVECVLVRAGIPMPSWAMVSAIRAEALIQARVQANTLIVMPMSMMYESQPRPIRLARSGIGAVLFAKPPFVGWKPSVCEYDTMT